MLSWFKVIIHQKEISLPFRDEPFLTISSISTYQIREENLLVSKFRVIDDKATLDYFNEDATRNVEFQSMVRHFNNNARKVIEEAKQVVDSLSKSY